MPMRCHYEVLGITRDAEADEIKRAYRKCALQWHPDKNREEGAEEQFRLVQSAYETLSEPKERAWYDAHRDAILRADDDDGNSGDGDEGGGYSARGGAGNSYVFRPPPDEFDVMAYFRSSSFRGFGTDSGGFYAVFSDVYTRLSGQEARAAEAVGREWSRPPPFGGPSTPFAHVVDSFYSFWLGFATLKQYEWMDKYAPHDASGRRERRAMEDENKRLRRIAQRDHNDAVRALTEFVRKRDPRYVAHAAAVEAANAKRVADFEARRKAGKEARRAAAAEARLNEPAEEDPDWMVEALERERLEAAARRSKGKKGKADGGERNAPRADVDGGDGDAPGATPRADAGDGAGAEVAAEVDGDGESEERELYCPVCNKRFKSDKQWANHERSKKHVDAVAALRRQLEREERAAQRASMEDPNADEPPAGHHCADEDDDNDNSDSQQQQPRGVSKAQKKRAAKLNRRFGGPSAAAAAADSSEEEVGVGGAPGKDKDDIAEELHVKAHVHGGLGGDAPGTEDESASASSEETSDGEGDESCKAEQRGCAAAAAASTATATRKPRRNKLNKANAAAASMEESKDTTCEICGEQHESRSALFRHLKAEHRLRAKK